MPPPPFIPPLDEDSYDRDVVAGLEGLHERTSDELFEPTSPKSKSEEEVGATTTATVPSTTRGATYPENRRAVVDRHQHETRSLPAVLAHPSGAGIGALGPSTPAAGRVQWPALVRSPEALSPPAQQAPGRPPRSISSQREVPPATTIYSTSIPPRPPTYPSSSISFGSAVPIPTAASSQFRTAETNPPITKSPPPTHRTSLVAETKSNQQPDKAHQRYAFGTSWITASDPFVAAPGRAIGSGTSGRRNLFTPTTPRHLMPSKSPDDSDDTRIAEIPTTSSQPTVPLTSPPSAPAPPASIYGMTGVISGGVTMGPSSGNDYSSFVPSPSHPSSRRQQQQQQHGYSRAAASAPAGQSGLFQPPHPHSHSSPAVASVYGPEYNSTRATPSPGYMTSGYGVPQYPSAPPQHPSQVGQQYPHRYPYGGPIPPPVVPHYPSFSQAAYGHFGVGGEMYGGPTPMYGHHSYVPSPETGPVSGPGHSPTTGIGAADTMATIPGAYPYPPGTTVPGNGGPHSNSPPAALGQPGSSVAPTGFQPHRVSPHGHPQSSPVTHSHSPHTPQYPQQYPTPPGNSPYAQYGPPSFQGSYSVSPTQPQGFRPYPSPPMAPEDPSQQLSPNAGQFQAPQAGGTWWYIPPGGGPPQAFPTGLPTGYEYQGPFTMSFGGQPQRAQPSHQPQPPQQPSTAAPESPEQPVPVTRGNSSRGAPAAKHTGQLRRGTAGRGARGQSTGQRGRGASQFPQPRGGGPSGAGLAAGSPSGGSASHSQPTTSSDPPQPVPGPPARQTFVTGLAAIRKGKEPVRQAFHPRPQAHGHEWVMWVGNIPDHATQNEVWNFFRNPQAVAYYMAMKTKNPNAPPAWPVLGSQQSQRPEPDHSEEVDGFDGPADGGVSSVFVIKSSNCAFVNFETEDALKRAMRIFNGVPLRPYDPECPPLVCRIRRKDDDLRTGVAAQRGWGLHTNWIRLQAEAMKKAGLVPDGVDETKKKGKGKGKETTEVDGELTSVPAEAASADLELQTDTGSSPQIIVPPHLQSHDDPPTSPSTHLGPSSASDPSPPVKLEYGSRRGAGRGRPMPALHHSSSASSGSYASTNSSFLTRYFPKRYFILKSLSEYDLNLSVERGIWATQPHNEPILDQAFRTSKEVWLIFGANKSGEFFGYARMMSGISRGERKVPWAGRSESNSISPRSGESTGVNRQRSSYSVIVEESGETKHRRELSYNPPSPLASKSPQFFGAMAALASSPSPLTPGETSGMPSPTVHLPRRANPASTTQVDGRDVPDYQVHSAPAELGPPHKKVTKPVPSPQPDTLDMPGQPIQHSGEVAKPRLDPDAPLRAAKRPHLLEVDKAVTEEDIRKRAETEGSSLSKAIERDAEGPSGARQSSEQWGTPFNIMWVKKDRLPFVRVKHLRNPWNYDREVKISRDGIELEPSVGEALLQEWDKMEAEREAFQKVLQAQWVQRDGQWYQADGRLAPSSGGPSSATDNTRASTARGADSRSP